MDLLTTLHSLGHHVLIGRYLRIPMTKANLIANIAKRTQSTKKEAERFLDALVESIVEALTAGETIDLRGFGRFKVHERKERQGRNPQTGESVTIAARKVAVFKSARELTARVNLTVAEVIEAHRLYSQLVSSDFGINPAMFNRWPYGREGFVQTGRLPMSRKVLGNAYRWHDPKYFWSGKDFCRTFEDGPWKWEGRQRYAGKSLNCGHYFAVTPEGATAEARYYGLDVSQLQLLRVSGSAGAVLDLTHEDNLIGVARMAIKNIDLISEKAPLMTILSMLTDESGPGGNALTDYIGYWAQNIGYDGILFYGARALKAHPKLLEQIRHGNDESLFGNIAYLYFEQMRRSYDLMNVVYFSGVSLARSVDRYAFPSDGPWTENVLFNKPEELIEQRLTYGRDFQQERQGRFTAFQVEVE